MNFHDGYEMLKKVMNEHPEIDAIFASVTDLVAIGIIKYFNEMRFQSERIAVLGFSNWFMSSVISPKLLRLTNLALNRKRFTSILFAFKI
jgi:LacI family transcriptional regulator